MRGRVWLGVLAVACVGETEPQKDTAETEETVCVPQGGTWTNAYTLAEGSDPQCVEIEDSTFEMDDEGEETTPSCDEGCSCQFEKDEATCSASLTQSCVDAESETDISCDFQVEDATHMSGECAVTVLVLSAGVTVSCTYQVAATHGG